MRTFLSRLIGAEVFRFPLLVFLFLVLSSFGFLSMASEDFSGKSVFQDLDQDGLTDEEEALYKTDPRVADTDRDGYGDGAEIRSGYDPAKAAPGDKIFSGNETRQSSKKDEHGQEGTAPQAESSRVVAAQSEGQGGVASDNLTEQVSEQIADILKNSSESAEGSAVSVQEMQARVQELLDGQGVNTLELPDVSNDEIRIQKEDCTSLSESECDERIRHDALEYVTKVSYILVSNAPETVSSPEDLEKISVSLMKGISSSLESGGTEYLDDLAEKGDRVLEELDGVEVPKRMVASHKKAIQLFRYAKTLRSELKPFESDPLSNIVVLSKAQGFLGLVSSLVKQIDSDMKDIGIEEIPLQIE